VRYLKGSISLRPQDAGLLHFVADARYITHSQLFELARLKAVEFDRPVFNWRVRRLVNSGLLRKQVVPYLGTDAMYSITRSGIHGLEEMGIMYLGGYVEREKDPAEVQIPHVLELNRIRLALERSHVLVNWIPEVMVRILNLSPALGYAKAYDAVATVRTAAGSAEFAIEYERTLKSEQKYEKILEAIEAERRLHTILYLAPSFEILSSLRCSFERARHDIVFALVSRFEKDVLATEVDLARVSRRMTLEQALCRQAAATTKASAVDGRDARSGQPCH
jgi:hypothetical protein